MGLLPRPLQAVAARAGLHMAAGPAFTLLTGLAVSPMSSSPATCAAPAPPPAGTATASDAKPAGTGSGSDQYLSRLQASLSVATSAPSAGAAAAPAAAGSAARARPDQRASAWLSDRRRCLAKGFTSVGNAALMSAAKRGTEARRNEARLISGWATGCAAGTLTRQVLQINKCQPTPDPGLAPPGLISNLRLLLTPFCRWHNAVHCESYFRAADSQDSRCKERSGLAVRQHKGVQHCISCSLQLFKKVESTPESASAAAKLSRPRKVMSGLGLSQLAPPACGLAVAATDLSNVKACSGVTARPGCWFSALPACWPQFAAAAEGVSIANRTDCTGCCTPGFGWQWLLSGGSAAAT